MVLSRFVLIVIASLAAVATPTAQKIDPKQLVAKHLESVGGRAALAARTTCIAEGDGLLRVLVGGSGSLGGPAVFLSEGPNIRFSMKFGQRDYPAEDFAFDGQTPQVGVLGPGRRSRLGQFLYLYKEIISEGLLGGPLSTAWALARLEERNPRLEHKGLKRIDGRQLHELQYRMKKGGGDLNINLYFEPDTLRHVRTTYKVTIGAQIGSSPEASPSQRESRYTLDETFDTFQKVESLTLPTRWTIRLNIDGAQDSSVTEWDTTITKIGFNQPIEPKQFVLR